MAINSQKTATKALEGLGWLIGRTESYSGYTGNSTDLWGFLDAVGITPYRMVGLQFCGQDFQDHVRKIEPLLNASKVNKVTDTYLIGVKKVLVKKGGKQMKYAYRIGYFKSLPDNKLEYVELYSWKDKQFDLECLVDIEKRLFREKMKEILTNEK